MQRITFIHAADLHLDSPFKGLANIPSAVLQDVRESTFRALDRLVDVAIRKQVDFVLLVGDLFDREKQSLKAQVNLRTAFEKLEEVNIPVYLSYGNHDHIAGNTYAVKYPDNVHIFGREEVDHFTYVKDHEPLVNIYGFSYVDRHIEENKVLQFIPNELNRAKYHIAMLHGGIQKNTVDDVYAPFKVSDMKEKSFDYWALGHIHERMNLSENPFIVYPGNIQGRHTNEQGPKGCYYVEMDKTETVLTFQRLDEIEYKTIEVDITEYEEVHQIESLIIEIIKRASSQKTLIQLELSSHNEQHLGLEADYVFVELIELINETIRSTGDWRYIFKYKTKFTRAIDESLIREGEHFLGELLRLADDEDTYPYIEELYEHREARKYINYLSNEEAEDIKEQAKQLLLKRLL